VPLLQRLCSIALVSLTLAPVASAQIRSATITGTVTDPTKAVVPGANVVITNQDTNATTELVTTDAGLFTAPYLAAGTYTIEVALPGFAIFKRTGVALATAETVRIVVELTVSKVGETVEVSARACRGRSARR
jgi:trimeric autotransporter adhesin